MTATGQASPDTPRHALTSRSDVTSSWETWVRTVVPIADPPARWQVLAAERPLRSESAANPRGDSWGKPRARLPRDLPRRLKPASSGNPATFNRGRNPRPVGPALSSTELARPVPEQGRAHDSSLPTRRPHRPRHDDGNTRGRKPRPVVRTPESARRSA